MGVKNNMSKIHPFTPTAENKINQSVYKTPIEGIYYLDYTIQTDNRGFFAELAKIPELDQVLADPFVIKQINLSNSKTNVARGFHCENWRKLIMVTTGTAFVAFVDVRPESDTFGQTLTATIGPDQDSLNGCFFLPTGIANSFLVLKGDVNYLYGVDRLYNDRDKDGDIAISLFDPDIGLDWPVAKEDMIYSQRDVEAINLRDKFPEKFK